MERLRKGKNGITLVALVVTIVILIILATISVNIVMQGGLIDRAQSGKGIYELQREKERLELVKADIVSNANYAGKVTVDSYIEELIKQGITTADKVTDNGDGSKTVLTDTGYKATIKPNGTNDIVISIEGDKIAENPNPVPTVSPTTTPTPVPELPDITPTTPAGTEVKKPSTWTSEKVSAIADGKGGIVPLPNGYNYIGGDYDTGLVISDKVGDTMDASGVNMRKPICVDTSTRRRYINKNRI